jgi:predicted RNA-binding protein YlxR (DUF448 family)
MCAVTRAVLPESELIRFVASPDGAVVPDLKAKLPGRGVWVRAERKMVAEAIKRNVFQRALEQPLNPPPDLADQVAARLREAALGRLGLVQKAGGVVGGFSQVETAITHDHLTGILAASDAAQDGERKVGQALRRRFGGENPLPVLRLFTSEELSLALGRPNVIHAAVLQGPAGGSFMEAAIRLQRYLGVDDGQEKSGAAEPSGKDE